jgi:uncharacterized repeat protein (TIGR01451 family)
VAFDYRWLGSDRPNWTLMNITTQLNDNSVGDLSTGEYGTASSVGTPPYCQTITSHAYCTAQVYLTNAHVISGFSFALINTVTTTVNHVQCALPADQDPPVVPAPSSLAVLEYSTNGALWIELARVACGVSGYDPDGTSIATNTVYSASFPSVTGCWVRLVTDYSYSIMTGSQQLDVTTKITDFRLTATDTGSACGYPPTTSCDISLSASASPSTASVGGSGTYTVTATNVGSTATTATEVTILPPIGFGSIAYTPSQGSVASGVWTIGAIAASASKTCSVAGTINRTGTLILSASLTGSTPTDTESSNNYARAQIVVTQAAGTGCSCTEVHDGPCPTTTFTFDGDCSGTWVVDECPGGSPSTITTWDFSMTSIVDFSQTTGVAFFDSTATG